MRKLKKRQVNEKTEITYLYLLKRCLLFTLIFMIIGFLCTVISGAVFYRFDDPTSMITPAGYIALYCSVIISAIFFTRGLKSRKLIGGAFFGVIIFVITYLISLIVGQKENGASELILRSLIILICIIISALPGVLKGKSKKPRRH